MADKEKPKNLKDMTLGDIVTEMFAIHKELEQKASHIAEMKSAGYQRNNPYPEVTVRQIPKHEQEYATLEQKFGKLKTELDRREKNYNYN